MNSGLLFLGALLGAVVAFALVYALARRINNYGIVDIAWSAGFAPVAAFYGHFAGGWLPRRLLITVMATLWSLRLGFYLYRRVMGHHPVEDARYQQLRREWGERLGPKMFRFFQLQALLLAGLSVPFLLAARNPAVGFHWLEWTGLALWVIALGGETLADAQLAAFKRDPANRGRVCATGLWRYSRHPNYFFEWLVWVAFWCFASASPWGWTTVLCPALMLYFLLRVTGIRYTEDSLLRSKGEAYRDYQRRTSAFVPWFPRGDPSPDSSR
jgi:steroid 5-alpha reductase family enzyme